jgi:hypothetical protein
VDQVMVNVVDGMSGLQDGQAIWAALVWLVHDLLSDDGAANVCHNGSRVAFERSGPSGLSFGTFSITLIQLLQLIKHRNASTLDEYQQANAETSG